MEENRNPNTALVPTKGNQLVAAEKAPGYWARVSRRYLWAFRVIFILIKIFAVLFVSLTASSFSGNGIYYFAKDLTSITSLTEKDRSTLYYNYGEHGAAHAAFRGGVATAHDNGVEILTAAGEPSLLLERAFHTPRIVASHHYALAYDLGGTAFSLCNAYDELYRGTTDAPIVCAAISDAGSFAVVTAAVTENDVYYPSEILLYNGNFKLVQYFKRSSATTAVALSEDGRYIAILGTADAGSLLDIYARKATKPQTSVTFEGFPCAVGFTSTNTAAAVTDAGLYTLRTDGKLYKSVSFKGQTLLAYAVDEKAVAVALQTDAVRQKARLVACDKKGNIKYENGDFTGVSDISLSDRTLWVLAASGASAVDLRRGVMTGTVTVETGAVAIEAVGRTRAALFYPAHLTDVSVEN